MDRDDQPWDPSTRYEDSRWALMRRQKPNLVCRTPLHPGSWREEIHGPFTVTYEAENDRYLISRPVPRDRLEVALRRDLGGMYQLPEGDWVSEVKLQPPPKNGHEDEIREILCEIAAALEVQLRSSPRRPENDSARPSAERL